MTLPPNPNPNANNLPLMTRKTKIREEQQTSGKKLANWKSYELRQRYVKWWDRSATGLVLASDIDKDVDLAMVLKLNVKSCCECSARSARRNV